MLNYNVTATRLTLYAFISSIEIDLRRFISTNITETNQSLLFDEKLKEKLIDRSKSSLEFDFDLSNLIQYLDFGDCINLINKFKRIFPQSFEEKLAKLTKELEKVTPVRNRVMHSRPLEFEDFPIVTDFIKEVKYYDFIKWTSTVDIENKISNDPSAIFSIKIPEFIDTSTDKVLNNLPPVEFDDTGFVGRSVEIQNIKQKIYGNYPVISIIGDGGIGKTALVLKCAYEIMDDLDQPFDAIVWASLKTKSLNNGEFKSIDKCISSTFELYNEIEKFLINDNKNLSDEEMINNIIEYMTVFKILLVLDNLETINSEAIRNFLQRIPHGSKIVITSRIGIGEFESRYMLSGFNKKERVHYMTRLASNYQLNDILRLGPDEIDSICTKLYCNPLAMKWFIFNVLKGEPIESILNHTDELTNYCMSNVYEKLSKDCKHILEILLIYSKECSDAELGYLVEGDPISRRKAINDLLATNMVKIRTISEDSIKKSVFSMTEFAREYLQQHCKPSNESFKTINKRIKNLKGLEQNLSVEFDVNPYDPKSLTCTQNSDELIAAYNLKQALFYSSRGNFSEAKKYIDKSKETAPNYFEVYKIAGFLAANNNDTFTADQEYQTAIQCKESYAPLLFLYAGFKMRYLDDFEEALKLTEQAEKLDDSNLEIKIQKARIYMLLNDYEKADRMFYGLLNDGNEFRKKMKRITVNYAADNTRRWSEKLIAEEDIVGAINLLKKSINFISDLDEADKDSKIITTVSKILLNLIYLFLKYQIQHDVILETIKTIFKLYGKSLTLCDNYSQILNRLEAMYPQVSSEDRKLIQFYTKDNIDELASTVANENEGYIVYKCRSYGFIKNKTYNKIFFYWKNCKEEFSTLKIGDAVIFKIEITGKGISANEVCKKTDVSINNSI